MSEEKDIAPEEALHVAQRALAKVGAQEDDIEQQQEQIDQLIERVVSLELRYEEESSVEYDPHDRDGNVGRVREHAFEKAVNRHGKAALNYDDIMWGVFDGEPSADYCYKLMRLAAKAEGFEFQDPGGKGKRLAVDAESAKMGVSFSSANKTIPEGAR